ncbi:MAG: hypothetical protein AAFY01_13325, partial [Pseudomonadota bacterium]
MGQRPETLRLDKLHSGDAQSAGHGQAVKLAMFNRIMSNHRGLPLLFPLIGVLVLATLETQTSALAVGFWMFAVVCIWCEIAYFSFRYFSGRLAPDPQKLSWSLSLRYLNANIVWSAMLLIFWSPHNTTQKEVLR